MERFVFGNKVPLRLLIWLLICGALTASLLTTYGFKMTSLNRTVPGLEPNTLYLAARSTDYCPSDVVLFRSFRRSKNYFRPVAALGETTFELTPAGYRVGETETDMPEDWRKAAADRLPASAERRLEPHEVLIVNADFGTPFRSDPNDWPFEVIGRDAIRAKVSTVLFAEDIGKIGQAVGSGESCHRATLGGYRLVPFNQAMKTKPSSRPHVPEVPFWSFALERRTTYNAQQKAMIAELRPSID